jgi:hypothetical protein
MQQWQHGAQPLAAVMDMQQPDWQRYRILRQQHSAFIHLLAASAQEASVPASQSMSNIRRWTHRPLVLRAAVQVSVMCCCMFVAQQRVFDFTRHH